MLTLLSNACKNSFFQCFKHILGKFEFQLRSHYGVNCHMLVFHCKKIPFEKIWEIACGIWHADIEWWKCNSLLTHCMIFCLVTLTPRYWDNLPQGWGKLSHSIPNIKVKIFPKLIGIFGKFKAPVRRIGMLYWLNSKRFRNHLSWVVDIQKGKNGTTSPILPYIHSLDKTLELY